MADFKSSVKRRFLALPDIAPTGGTGELRDLSPGYWFGPLHPISPVTPSDYRPRQYGYTPGANIIWQPKGDSGIGYDILRSLADSWDLLRLVIETRKDQLGKLSWDVRVKEEAGETKSEHKQRTAKDPQIKLIKDFLNCPDGTHTWAQWLRLWVEDVLVLDGVSLYLERDKQKKVASVHPLDPATISRLITEQGFTPPAPQPAYQQVVYGVVAADLTQDDLLFVMRNERTHRRYGYSPVEQILMTISIGLSRQEFQLQYYSSGNMPEALCFLPSDMPIDKVKEVQDWFDSVLSGDLAKRRRLTFLPGYGGSQSRAFRPNVVFPKQVLLKDEMDEWLARIVAYAFSVSPQNLMRQMNRASAEQGQQNAEEEGLEPMKSFITDVVNVLIQKKLGMEDYEFTFEANAEIDALKQAQIDQALVGRIQTINEIREARGLDPREEPEADMLGEFTQSGFMPITGARTSEAPPPPPQLAPGQPGAFGGDPDAQEGAAGSPGGDQAAQGAARGKAGKEKPEVPPGPHGRNGKGKLTGAAVGKRGSRLRRRPDQVLTAAGRVAETRLKAILAGSFAKQLEAVRREAGKITKISDDEVEALLHGIMDQLHDIWIELPADVQAELTRTAQAAIGEQLATVGATDEGMIASVNQAAQEWARDRAAEMVGMRYDAAGALVENPSAQFAITATTRADLTEAIAAAFGPAAEGEGWGLDALIQRIMDLGTFSEERAGTIARTEVTRAQAEANMELWEQSGMVQSVQWLTSQDPDVCDVCQGYADDGPFDLAEAPVPVVDSHPNCRCVVAIAELDEDLAQVAAGAGGLEKYSEDQARDDHGRWTEGGGAAGAAGAGAAEGPQDRSSSGRPSGSPIDRESHLSSGRVKEVSELGGGVSVTKMVEFDDGSMGVFKPASGEDEGLRPDVADGYQTQREVGAWEVAKLVGMDDLVTPCIARVMDNEPGALQEFQDGKLAKWALPDQRYDGERDLARAAVFDYVVGNEDRHAGNWLLSADGKLLLIDHGLAFPDTGYDPQDTMINNFFVDRAAEQGIDPGEHAGQYVAAKDRIAAKLTSLGLSEGAVAGVKTRIDNLAKAPTWNDLFVRHESSSSGHLFSDESSERTPSERTPTSERTPKSSDYMPGGTSRHSSRSRSGE